MSLRKLWSSSEVISSIFFNKKKVYRAFSLSSKAYFGTRRSLSSGFSQMVAFLERSFHDSEELKFKAKLICLLKIQDLAVTPSFLGTVYNFKSYYNTEGRQHRCYLLHLALSMMCCPLVYRCAGQTNTLNENNAY